MQMYEVTALAPEGPEEVYREMVFAEDEDDALNQLEEQLKEQRIAHGCAWRKKCSVKRTSNHSEQGLFREEVLSFTRKFVPMAQNL